MVFETTYSTRLRVTKSLFLLTFGFCFLSISLNAQILTGGPSHTPSEVTAGPVNEGSVSGEVNLFSGTYDLTHTLGTVSGINGPSFTLTASYSSVVNSGTVAPTIKGGQLGEGWGLNLPTITCSVEDYEKYSPKQREIVSNWRSQGYHIFYLANEISTEKSLFFFNVNFSIPGVGGGKLVYKYTKGNVHHFAQQTFETPVTATLFGSLWTITAPNGDRYEFLPQATLRKNGNLRTHRSLQSPEGINGDCFMAPPRDTIPRECQPYNFFSKSQEVNVEPRESVMNWICSKITNPFSTDAIVFEHESYGEEVDHFANWRQEAFSGLPFSNAYNTLPKFAEGFILKYVRSSIETLELNYEELDETNPEDSVDLMYRKKLVYDSQGSPGNNWRRYLHVSMTTGEQTKSSSFHASAGQNPYVRDVSGQGFYNYESTALPADFDHAFFESPSLNLTPGATYKVEFEISNSTNPALFDLNVVAGSQSPPQGNGVEVLNDYKNRHAINIFSTFQDPVKYYTNGSGTTSFGSFFVPQIIHSSNKFVVQIGPASSDSKYDQDLSMPNAAWQAAFDRYPNIPQTITSYFDYPGLFHQGYTIDVPQIGTPNESLPQELSVYPTDPVPSNFGIGIPWFNMLGFYSKEIAPNINLAGNSNWFHDNTFPDSDIPQFVHPFWWKPIVGSGNGTSLGNWDNIPTTAGENVKLNRVKIYEYYKKALVLSSVKKYVRGLAGTPSQTVVEQNFGNEIASTHLQYDLVFDQYQIAFRTTESNATVAPSDDRLLGTVLLRTIVNTPIGESVVPKFNQNSLTDYPTTKIEYEKLGQQVLDADFDAGAGTAFASSTQIMANLPNCYIINGHTSPIGKRTTISYKSYTSSVGGSSYILGTYFGDPNPPVPEYLPGVIYPIEENFTAKAVALVDHITLEDKSGPVSTYYEFAGTRSSKLTGGGLTIPHKNLKDFYVHPQDIFGYQNTTVFGPLLQGQSASNQGIRTEYKHHVDPVLRGKLNSVKQYDEDNQLVSETVNNYSFSLAFEPGFIRQNRSDVNSTIGDYAEYEQSERLRPSMAAIHSTGAFEDIITYYKVRAEQFDIPLANQIPKVSAQWLYSPWTPLPDHSRHHFLSQPERYEDLNTMFSASSFFIKLNSTSTTSYADCPEDPSLGVTSTTSYTYYETDFDGAFDAATFEKISPSIGNGDRLIREPSFLPASKTMTSTGSEVTETEEYFYIWDLKNVSSFLQGGNSSLVNEVSYGLLSKLAEDGVVGSRPVRNLTYETRKIYGDGTVQSTFNQYSTNVAYEYDQYTEIDADFTVECPSGEVNGGNDVPDTGEPGSGPGNPDGNGCYVIRGTDPLPQGYCRQSPDTFVACPCEEGDGEFEVPDHLPAGEQPDYQGAGKTSNYKNYSFLDDIGDGPGPMEVPTPEDRFLPVLAGVYVQIAAPNDPDDQRVDLSAGLENLQVLVPNRKTYNLQLRTTYNLPVITSDVKGLETQYYYAPTTVFNYQKCVRNQFVLNASALFNPNAGLPDSIKISHPNYDFSLTTAYTYDDRRTVSGMTDPNGIEYTYDYDGFRRLKNTYRNGLQISLNEYKNYVQKTPGQTYSFEAASLENFVATTSFISTSASNTSRNFLDPLGRASGESINFSGGTGAGGGHVVGAVEYDIFGRSLNIKPIGPESPFIAGSGQNINYVNYDYSPAPRNQVTATARQGLSLDGDHVRTTSTCFVQTSDLEADVTAAGNTVALSYLPGGIVLSRTETIDEDGKKYINYTDVNGLSIATISFEAPNGNTPYAATVNRYDGRGNLLATVNPKGQITSYQYNYLGLPFEISSPDAGLSKVAYNVEGNVLATLNGNGKQTSFRFDKFGRQIEQWDGSVPSVFANQGLPWVSLTGQDLYYIDDFAANDNPEKIWQYDEYTSISDLSSSLPANFQASKTLGRVAATFSYDDTGKPIHGMTLKYDGDGFVSEEVAVFSTTDEEINYKVAYGDFTLTGAPRSVAVDVNNDGNDFTHHYKYDGLGRVTEVSITVPEKSILEQKVATYVYDPNTTQVQTTTYFNDDNQVLSIGNSYDVADRLEFTGSRLFNETIIYDEDGGGYFNGNIFSTKVEYKIDDFIPGGTMLSHPGKYAYQYDGLNRLKSADYAVDAQIFDGLDEISGDLSNFGDATYEYDLVGNLTKTSRTEYEAELNLIGLLTNEMSFPAANNRLETVTSSGLGFSNPTQFAYQHNGAGYLILDEKRDNAISYTRGTFPAAAGGDVFAYDVNDQRIHKKGDNNEYYLRNSAGQELAIVDFNDLSATWYCFGVGRFAQIGTSVGDCGLVECRPEAPAVDVDPNTYTQTAIQNLNATNPGSITYPVTLFRIQLPSDEDLYLLGSELTGLDGKFNVLQQITLYSEEDFLSAHRISTDNTDDLTFLEFFALRKDFPFDFLLNGFHICEEKCYDEVFSCDPAVVQSQETVINTLRNQNASVSGEQSFTIVRMRLCNGTEIYGYQKDLEEFPGAVLILQRIYVEVNGFGGISYTLDDQTQIISTVGEIHTFMYDVNTDWQLEGYSSCLSELICTDEIPECGPAGSPDYTTLQQVYDDAVINAATLDYPVTLNRVRFCDGRDLHLLAEEIAMIADGGFAILQELIVATASDTFAVVYQGGDESMTLSEFLAERTSSTIIRIGNFPPCPIETSCETPTCSEGDLAAQTSFISNLESSTSRLDSISYPTQITSYILCSGQEVWLTDEEFNALPGLASLGQTLNIPTENFTFQVEALNGYSEEVTLTEFFGQSFDTEFLVVGGLRTCAIYQEEQCLDLPTEPCSGTASTNQTNYIQGLINQYNGNCGPSVLKLSLVELCNGERFYLTDDELSNLTGQFSVLQIVESQDLTQFFLVALTEDPEGLSLSWDQILCQRFDDIILILNQDCVYESGVNTVNCTTEIISDEYRAHSAQDSYEVNLSGDLYIEQACDGETTTTIQDTFSDYFRLRTDFFNSVTYQEEVGAVYSIFSIDLIDQFSGISFTVTFQYNQLEADFSGINSYLSTNYQFYNSSFQWDVNSNNLYLENPGNNLNIFEAAVKYAVSVSAGRCLSNQKSAVGIDVNYDSQQEIRTFSLFSYVMNEPTSCHYTVPPCQGAVKINVQRDSTTDEIDLLPIIQIVGVNSTADPLNEQAPKGIFCNQTIDPKKYFASRKAGAQASKSCVDDTALNYCQLHRIDEYSFDPSICTQLKWIAETTIEFSPTVEAINQSDLTLLFPTLKGQSDTTYNTCQKTLDFDQVTCTSKPITCFNGNCPPDLCNPTVIQNACTPAEIAAVADQLAQLDAAFASYPTSIVYPTNLHRIRFCGDEERFLLTSELSLLSVPYRVLRTIPIEEKETPLRIESPGGNRTGTLNTFLAERKDNPTATASLAPVYENPAPGLDPLTGYPEGNDGEPVASPLTFYIHDHLGNTRITFRADNASATSIEYAADFFPYGKVLREYAPCEAERFLTTHHERDKDSGYDNRGARLYDSEIGRFLGVDPLAGSFQPWSPYNYVLGNPVIMVDPDGRSPMWIDNGDGTYTAEAGDSAYSLAKQTGMSNSQANSIVENQLGSNYIGADGKLKSNVEIGDLIVADVNACEVCHSPLDIGGSETVASEEIKISSPFFSNKMVELSTSGAIIGGFGFGVGAVFDEQGEYAIFASFSGHFGIGGGTGVQVSDIYSTTGDPFSATQVGGVDVSTNISLPLLGYSRGGNVNNPIGTGNAFTRGGKPYVGDRYRFRSGSIDGSAFIDFKDLIDKPYAGIGVTRSITNTSILYSSRDE